MLFDEGSHVVEERGFLANHLFEPATQSTFAVLVDVMSRLCQMSEGRRVPDRDVPESLTKVVDVTPSAPEQIETDASRYPNATGDGASHDAPRPDAPTQYTATQAVATRDPSVRDASTQNAAAQDNLAQDVSMQNAPTQPTQDGLTCNESVPNLHLFDHRAGTEDMAPLAVPGFDKPPKIIKLKLNPPSPMVSRARKPFTSLTCLFCYGNPKRARTQTLARSDSLRRHYRQVHFQYQVGPFPCPLPDCEQIIRDADQFANHAVRVHKSHLGVRAVITNTLKRNSRPGQLATFVL